MSLLISLAVSLLMTLFLEMIAALIWKVPRRDWIVVVLVNILTNPVVVFLHTAVSLYARPLLVPVTALLELGAVLVEGWFYREKTEIRNPWSFSVFANVLSFLVGLFLTM